MRRLLGQSQTILPKIQHLSRSSIKGVSQFQNTVLQIQMKRRRKVREGYSCQSIPTLSHVNFGGVPDGMLMLLKAGDHIRRLNHMKTASQFKNLNHVFLYCYSNSWYPNWYPFSLIKWLWNDGIIADVVVEQAGLLLHQSHETELICDKIWEMPPQKVLSLPQN